MFEDHLALARFGRPNGSGPKQEETAFETFGQTVHDFFVLSVSLALLTTAEMSADRSEHGRILMTIYGRSTSCVTLFRRFSPSTPSCVS